MKLSKKENLKIAKKLFLTSFTRGELDATKVRKNTRLAKAKFKSDALSILKSYLNLLKQYLAKETLTIEAAGKLHLHHIQDIKNRFEKIEGRTLNVSVSPNPKLLGGLRVSLGDTQWDYSTKGRITKMKEDLSGQYR
ncbi:MAG TPA: F0F1 ATP synthase subunit delta [Candidatus Nanoarchaeia archaeon]